MQKFISAGGLTGLFAFASAVATVCGKAGLASQLADPSTIGTVGLMVTGIAGAVAGFLPNHKAA